MLQNNALQPLSAAASPCRPPGTQPPSVAHAAAGLPHSLRPPPGGRSHLASTAQTPRTADLQSSGLQALAGCPSARTRHPLTCRAPAQCVRGRSGWRPGRLGAGREASRWAGRPAGGRSLTNECPGVGAPHAFSARPLPAAAPLPSHQPFPGHPRCGRPPPCSPSPTAAGPHT